MLQPVQIYCLGLVKNQVPLQNKLIKRHFPKFSDSSEIHENDFKVLGWWGYWWGDETVESASSTSTYDGARCTAINYTPFQFQQPQDPVQTQAREEDRYILDGQNTRLSQVSQKQTTYLPDGIPSFRMQITYLSKFFGTHWYLVQKDTYAMYAIYDALFSDIPHSTQLTPFDLVTLDTDLWEHLEDRSSHINTRRDQVAQISDSYSKWIEAAAVSKNFPQSMLSLNDRHQIYSRFCYSYWFSR